MSIKRFLMASILTLSTTPVWANANVVKVCNYRSATIWAAYQFYPSELAPAEITGWYRYEPNQCRDVLKNFGNFFWIFAKEANGWTSTGAFVTSNLVHDKPVCVGSGAYKQVPATACKDGLAGYRYENGHLFDFSVLQDYNVYEIGYH